MPLLSFREVWIVTRNDEYVLDCLNTTKNYFVHIQKTEKKQNDLKITRKRPEYLEH